MIINKNHKLYIFEVSSPLQMYMSVILKFQHQYPVEIVYKNIQASLHDIQEETSKERWDSLFWEPPHFRVHWCPSVNKMNEYLTGLHIHTVASCLWKNICSLYCLEHTAFTFSVSISLYHVRYKLGDFSSLWKISLFKLFL